MAPSNVHRPLPQSWSSPSPQTIANYNGTLQWHHVHSPKVGRHPPPNHSTLQWHPAMAPSNVHRPLPQSWSSPSPQTIANYNGTLQWHPQSWPSPLPSPTIAHYNGTLQWHQVCSLPQSWSSCHPAMAPRTPPKLAVTLPCPHHSTLQWHPAMTPRPLPQSWSSPSPPTIAHYSGTLRYHSNGTTSSAPWWHVQSAKVVRRPPPPFGSKNPHSYRYLGNNIYLLVFIELETLKVTEVLTYHHVIRHFGHLPSLASIEARASLPNLCDLDLVGFVPTESPLTRHETRVKTLRSGTCRRNGEPRIVSKIWHRNCKKKWSLLLAMRGIRLF